MVAALTRAMRIPNLPRSGLHAVAFDAFGTLLFSPQPSAYRHLAGATAPDERRRLLTSAESLELHARRLGSAIALPKLLEELDAELGQIELFPDVLETITKLRKAGLQIAVCSNLASDYVPAVRRLLPPMDAYVMSCEVGAVKPEPGIFQALCDALRMGPGEVLFIGNSARCDVEGPRSFGFPAIHLQRDAGMSLGSTIAAGLD